MGQVHACASVAKQSVFWVCTEIPLSMSPGLSWCLFPAPVSNWTWLSYLWKSVHSSWNTTWTDICTGVKQRCDRPQPLVGCTIRGGLGLARGWLMAGTMGLARPAFPSVLKFSRKSSNGLDSYRSVSDPYSWTLLGGMEWYVGCS